MDHDVYVINWSTNQRLPLGYRVIRLDYGEGHYMGERIDGTWESAITVNRWDARRWCIDHYIEVTCAKMVL